MKKTLSLLLIFTVFVVGCSQTIPQIPNERVPLKLPPQLTVTVGNKSVSAVLGTYSWTVDNGDGTMDSYEADAIATPELVKLQKESINITPESSIILDFEVKPYDYTVEIWQDNNGIPNPVPQQVSNDRIITQQQKGMVIYIVVAKWKEGVAYYAFSVNID